MTTHDFKKNAIMTVVSTLKGMMMGHLYTYSSTLIATKDKRKIRDLKVYLSKEFEMKDLGTAMKLFGM